MKLLNNNEVDLFLLNKIKTLFINEEPNFRGVTHRNCEARSEGCGRDERYTNRVGTTRALSDDQIASAI